MLQDSAQPSAQAAGRSIGHKGSGQADDFAHLHPGRAGAFTGLALQTIVNPDVNAVVFTCICRFCPYDVLAQGNAPSGRGGFVAGQPKRGAGRQTQSAFDALAAQFSQSLAVIFFCYGLHTKPATKKTELSHRLPWKQRGLLNSLPTLIDLN
jgi:hypothetical protein